ncbi:MAG: CHAT domain-containing tetratricopeptide repeat protein [Acidobacteriota bacterium]
MSDRETRRERLVRSLGSRSTLAKARRVVAASPDLADAETARALFTAFHRTLLQSPKKAKAALAGASALARAAKNPEVEGWRLRIEGTLAHASGNSVAAAKYLALSAAQMRRARQPLEEGDIHRVLIDVFARLGDDRAAKRAATRAVSCYARGGVTRGRQLGDVAMNLGNVHQLRERLSQALECYQKAQRSYTNKDDRSRQAAALLNQAVVLTDLDRRKRARACYERARRLYSSLGATSMVLWSEYGLAGIDSVEGQLDRAIATLSKLRSSCQESGETVLYNYCALELGEAQLQANLIGVARETANSALQQFTAKQYPADQARAHGLLAGAALRDSDLATARREFQRAASIQARLKNKHGSAFYRLGEAVISLRSGHAAAAYKMARASARVLSADAAPSRHAKALTVASSAALALGRSAVAAAHAKQALTLAQRSGDRRSEVAARLACAHERTRQSDRRGAFTQLLRAERLVEAMRLGVTREESRLAFAIDKLEVYEALVANRLAVGGPKAWREALTFAERGKARALAERLARTGSTRVSGGSSAGEARGRLEQIERDLAAAERRLAEGTGPPGIRGSMGPRVASLTRARSRALGTLDDLAPASAWLHGAGTEHALSMLDRLTPGELLIEYFVAGGEVHLFVGESGRLEVFPGICRGNEVSEIATRLRFHLGKGVLGETHHVRFGELNGAACRHYLERLHELLLNPIASRLDGKNLRIVPHGVLHGLPFHAFESGGTALISRAVVSYAPSLSVLDLISRRERLAATAPPLVLGVPDAAAPQIAAEVRAVSLRLPTAQLRTGAEATRAALEQGMADRPLLHVACHGFYAQGDAIEAGLRLGDAWMDLTDIYALQETAPLVVLSGCETGRGTLHSGDDWVGLVSGFLQAGANTVVAALWELHDASAAILMDDFYSGLSLGRTAAEAMAGAQRRARATDPSPLRWAPFAVVGDPFYGLPARIVA